MTVAIIDCGGSNLRSVSMAIKRLDMDYIVTDDVSLINSSEFVILPGCLLYTSPSPRDVEESRMPSSA